jgi:hypothetical protein
MEANSDTARSHLGDPDFTEEMSVLTKGASVSITIPSIAVRYLGYEVGEKREIEVYEDGVFIPAEAPDE